MNTFKAAEGIDRYRRFLVGGAAAIAAAIPFGIVPSAKAQPARTTLPPVKAGANTTLGALKKVDAGVLNVAYAEAGPADGPPVILLHGWP
jgi:hypothetical protein